MYSRCYVSTFFCLVFCPKVLSFYHAFALSFVLLFFFRFEKPLFAILRTNAKQNTTIVLPNKVHFKVLIERFPLLPTLIHRLTIFNSVIKFICERSCYGRILPKPLIKLLLIITCKVYLTQLLVRKVVKPLVHVNWELISFLLNHVQRFNWNLPAPSMSLNIVEEFCFSSIVCSDRGCDSSEPLQKCQPRP